MKKITLITTLVLTLLVAFSATAQQGFGTNQPDRSAAVDIVSSKRGLLIPRVALTNTTSASPVTAPAEALMVYNTASTGDVIPGFYYWEAGKWVRFVASDSEKTVTVTEGENINVETTVDTNTNTTDYEVSIQGGAEGQVLVTNATGGTVWIDPSVFIDGVITADNGLNIDTNNIQLGGVLTEATTVIGTDGAGKTLAITGLEDISGGFDGSNQNIVVMGADGVLKLIKISTLVEASETLTVLSYDTDLHQLTYVDEEGDTTTLDLNVGSVAYDAVTNNITYTDEKGDETELVLNNTDLSYDATEQELIYVNNLGVTQTIDLGALVTANETLTVLDYNVGTHQLTYLDEAGVTTTLDLNVGSVVYNPATNNITYTDEKGTETELELNNTDLSYDGTDQELIYINNLGVTQTIDLGVLVTANETLTVLDYNVGTHQLTYLDEAGVTTTLDLKVGSVVYDAATNNITYTDEKGAETELELNNTDLSYDATEQELTYINNLGVTEVIDLGAAFTVTADNGLTMDANNIQLGGLLIEDTEIDATNNTLAVKGLENSTEATANIVLEEEGTGVLRNVARSLEVTTGTSLDVTNITGYNKFVPEVTVLANLAGNDINITLPSASDAKGQVINVKINESTDEAYVNIPNVDGVTIYGAMPFQGWIIKSNGSTWSVVGRN